MLFLLCDNVTDKRSFVLQQSVAEGGLASFIVERTQGSVGRVTIEWELEAAGRQDLSPIRGTLLFQGVSCDHLSCSRP